MGISTTQKSVLQNKGFKIGACDWNLGKTADPGCFAIAKEIGLDGVQISLGTVKDNMSLRQKYRLAANTRPCQSVRSG